MINPINVERLADQLIRLAADYEEASPTHRAVRKADLHGACRATWAVGYGESAEDILATVMDVVDFDPRPPADAAEERTEWHAKMTDQLAAVLQGIWAA